MSAVIESKIVQTVVALPARGLLGLIRLYQLTLSPVLPIVFGPNCGCRFHPTCSHYAAGAVRTHGAVRGTALAIWRLLKCTPLHPGGFDPVPPVRSTRPVCERVGPPLSAR
ncbi:membrane protein insertion efficiency factor YidD [Synoicihabitans lomoniglobus]|uniref:Putative membrane protein insertion efficiency factor n=1 Tax=Synoicihabitans lomoniglobus TaxID=2909285 RepID=A0AAF0CMV2_9BACT|nr:membrane protein insertion efficiency factor YidD [Opitutaceae bacterium LMO-M01]WED63816.1 membrane protein insertion efficiency factor YidD [Opitutaceae bacterium LMO-M01]